MTTQDPYQGWLTWNELVQAVQERTKTTDNPKGFRLTRSTYAKWRTYGIVPKPCLKSFLQGQRGMRGFYPPWTPMIVESVRRRTQGGNQSLMKIGAAEGPGKNVIRRYFQELMREAKESLKKSEYERVQVLLEDLTASASIRWRNVTPR